MAETAGLEFVAGRWPIIGAHLPIAARRSEPFEILAQSHLPEGMATICRMVGADAELGSWREFCREQIEWPWIDEAALGVARLGPWVGVEKEDTREARVGQAFEDVERVAHMQADVGQPAGLDVPERADDAVEEWLGPDEADAGVRGRLRGEMLARAEADLEPQRTLIILGVAEQRRRVDRSGRGDADRRQQRLDEIGLTGAELVPLTAPIETAEGGGAGCVIGGQATAALSLSTRSSFSQLKPPSASGVRPKWP